MRTKKVNRYYCEYCKKSGCSSYWMKKHETRCTLNPDRYCGYCNLLEQEQTDLNKLLVLLPKPDDYLAYDEFGNKYFSMCLNTAVNKALPKLRNIAGSCPACIMAALRQRGIPVPIADDFDFKKECEEIWGAINQAAYKKEMDSYVPY